MILRGQKDHRFVRRNNNNYNVRMMYLKRERGVQIKILMRYLTNS